MLQNTGFISKNQKEQILNSTDIVQLIGDYIHLKSSGKNFVGLCPFHQEKTPSFFVSPSYQNYKCYGCGESGDAIRFVMGIENLQFVEAMDLLARKAGIVLKVESGGSTATAVKSKIDRCLEETFQFFRNNLKSSGQNSRVQLYLTQRQLSAAICDQFEIGFVDQGWNNLNQHLTNKSFGVKTQEEAGLIKQGEKGGHYDRLRHRLIFPIRNRSGRLLGFAGRAIGDEEPKYLNPPETELYKKSGVFYGVNLAHQQIRRKRRAIVVEGYLDVMRLHENSWTETIATCGTSLSAEHVSMLKKLGAEEVLLLFDGDSAGIKAAERSARLFIENDLDSKVVVLPDGLDPDDYFKQYDSKDFGLLLEKAAYDFEFIIARSKENSFSKGIQHRESVIKEVIELAKRIESSIKRDLFLSKVGKEFDIARPKLSALLHQNGQTKKPSAPIIEETPSRYFDKEHLPEVKFLQYLINHVQSISLAREKISTNDFTHSELSDIYARFLQLTDEEFKLLSAKDFPDIFVEHGNILMYLLHHDSEYKGPVEIRPGSEEMNSLREEHLVLTQQFSEQALNLLINRVKKNRRDYEIKRMRYVSPDQVRESLRALIEQRKGNDRR